MIFDGYNKTVNMEIKEAKKNGGCYILENNVVMPDFTCKTNHEFKQDEKENEKYSFNLKKSNKHVFINFWATWCGPCVRELKYLQELYEEYKDKIDFVFINCGSSENELTNFAKSNNYTFPIGFDEDDYISNMFSVRSIPMTVIVNKDKVIKNIIIGAVSKNEYKNNIEEVLKNNE